MMDYLGFLWIKTKPKTIPSLNTVTSYSYCYNWK